MKNLKRNLLAFFKKISPFLVIVGIVLVFFWKVVIKGLVPIPADLLVGAYLPWSDYKWGYSTGVPVKNPIVSDSISFIYPARILGVDLIKSGQWPLWNPYLFQGAPLLANFQSAPFSPTNVLYLLFDNATAWSWQVLLQHVAAFIFCYVLLRHWKVSKLGSIVGSFSFAFSGFCTIWSQWGVHTLVTAFIPLVFYFEDQLVLTRKYRYGVGLSISIAMQLFSGYPQIVLYTLVGVGALYLVRIWGSRQWILQSLLLGVFVAIGIGVASLQAFPANELVEYSQRKVEPIPLQWVFMYPKEIITFFAPDYFGNHATANYWGPKNYLATVGFVGIVTFVLAVIGLKNIKRREVIFLWISLFISLILAFKTPIGMLLWEKNIFGLKAGVSYKSLALFTLSLSVAAGFGVDCLLSLKQKIKNMLPLIIPWLVIAGYGLVTVYLYQITKNNPELSIVRGISKYSVAFRNLVFPGLILVLITVVLFAMQRIRGLRKVGVLILFALMIVELFRFGWKFTPFVPKHIVYPTTPVWDFLIKEKEKGIPFRVSGGDITSVNLNVPYKIEFLGGYDAVYPLVAAKFIAAVNSGKAGGSPQDRFGIVSNPTSRLTNLMNMKYLFIKSGSLYDKNRFTPIFTDKSVAVLENKDVLPRAFMVYGWETEKDENTILDKLLKPGFPLGEKIFLEDQVKLEKQKGVYQGHVESISYAENQSIYKVDTQKDGMLFVSDTYYPGWKAYVDGKEERIYKADFAFRAVPVGSGKHTVKFVYFPQTFARGLEISKISLGLLVIFYLPYKLVTRKRPRYT